MYNALIVAEYIIDYCSHNGISISNLKLQKVLYFLQVQFLYQYKVPCFTDSIEAWSIGPVVPNVFHRFLIWGTTAIPANFRDDQMYMAASGDLIEEEYHATVNLVIENLRNYSVSELNRLSMNQQPWKMVYFKSDNAAIIPVSLIRAYLPKTKK